MVNRVATSGDYTLDAERSRIGFTARHALISKVRGHFGEFEGSAHLDFDDPGELESPRSRSRSRASTPATVPATSNCGSTSSWTPRRTRRSRFTSTQVEQISDQTFRRHRRSDHQGERPAK